MESTKKLYVLKPYALLSEFLQSVDNDYQEALRYEYLCGSYFEPSKRTEIIAEVLFDRLTTCAYFRKFKFDAELGREVAENYVRMFYWNAKQLYEYEEYSKEWYHQYDWLNSWVTLLSDILLLQERKGA